MHSKTSAQVEKKRVPGLPTAELAFTRIRTGVDIVPVGRIGTLIEKYGDRFAQRVFTSRELALCGARTERLAARFAAKEAVSKAFGTGIGRISWREIEVINDSAGQPQLVLAGKAEKMAEDLGLSTWAISLSHTLEQAIAVVVAAG